MPRKVWIVSELYYPEETSTGYFLTHIAEGLSSHYPVNALCGQPSYSARGIRAPSREVYHGVTIRRCPATTLNKDVFLFKIINLFTISLSILGHALWLVGRDDIVLVATNPPVLPFCIVLTCRLRRAKCVLLVQDVYPESLVASGIICPTSIVTRILNRLNRWLYCEVKCISVLGRDMKSLVRKKRGGNHRNNILINRNWADLKQVSPNPRNQNPLLKELGLTHKFVLQYAGNMGHVHGIEDLLETARLLNLKNKDIHFLFIGFGAKQRWFESAVEENKLQNVTILPNRPRSNQHVFLNACDIAITAFVPGMTGVGVPSRMYNILAAGKPIIGAVDADSELALVILEEDVGWVVSPNQPEILADTIVKAQSNPNRLFQMGKRARAAAENKYSFQHAIESYRSMIRDVDKNEL